MHLLITGASGSGTSTLGRALAAKLQIGHIDLDDFYWIPTVPPFREKREHGSRFTLLRVEMTRAIDLVASGSLMEWGLEVEDSFSLIVFLTAPAAIRVARLQQRELELYGMCDEAFLAWAAQYDEGTLPGRSRQRHEDWLAKRICPILRADGARSLEESAAEVMRHLQGLIPADAP